MSTANFILTYIESCTSGRLGPSECGPIWQLGVIAVLLLAAVATLVVMRLRSRAQPGQA